MKADVTVEPHVGRVWLVSTLKEQFNLFVESDAHQKYLTLYKSFKIPSIVPAHNVGLILQIQITEEVVCIKK